jgi:hypothetical protein
VSRLRRSVAAILSRWTDNRLLLLGQPRELQRALKTEPPFLRHASWPNKGFKATTKIVTRKQRTRRMKAYEGV